MSDTPGNAPQNGPRQAMKSPRAALEPEAAPPPPPASRHARNQWVVIGNLIVTIALVVLVGGMAAFLYARQAFIAPGPLQQDRAVFIERGSTAETVAQTLERNGVIDSALLFSAAVQLYGVRSDLKWGEYLFPKGASTAEALAIVLEGKAIEYRVTIPEGLTSEQIVGRLRDNDVLTGEIARIPREGSLLPDTYRFTRGTTRQQIVDMMTREQQRRLQEIWARRRPDLPLRTPEELVTLASIVEKETGKAEERPRVAGVFINRLTLPRPMRLQSDPTIIYGIVGGRGALGRPISQSDIQRLTPYNTYQIDGLPPTPIGNPGRAAMEAVANPARHREIFFVADGTGGHAFAETLEQHNRNVANWRRIERERGEAASTGGGTAPPAAAADAAPAAPATPPRTTR
ncbi:endolytic transglycosylase MltG [Phreatobacter sp.]|uniref:endolytic transglycosylase MltG n=1 Tax=Phreatobacter sp. TaxID=1966341 RepID=UPI0022BF517B|nr:endolytic transglycosylase MltG [Phreatobacter sp.]MCZ8315249.1 endolytic transglycosylase MltG [Phreatobacter sp.]